MPKARITKETHYYFKCLTCNKEVNASVTSKTRHWLRELKSAAIKAGAKPVEYCTSCKNCNTMYELELGTGAYKTLAVEVVSR